MSDTEAREILTHLMGVMKARGFPNGTSAISELERLGFVEHHYRDGKRVWSLLPAAYTFFEAAHAGDRMVR